jgi:hypothetical protein
MKPKSGKRPPRPLGALTAACALGAALAPLLGAGAALEAVCGVQPKANVTHANGAKAAVP